MRGVVFLGDRRVDVRTFADPEPGAGEVVIRMRASGLCGSDFRSYRLPKAQPPEELTIGGHEPCGVVAQVGPGVSGVREGDRVMMHHYSGCGRCKMCRIGYTQMCVARHLTYGFSAHGGHADYLLAPASTCIPMPEGLSFEEGAACACGAGTAFHAVKRVGVSGVDTIAIFGQGPVGLSATLFASAMGARVLAVDVMPERLALARKFGADAALNASEGDPVAAIRELTGGEGADAALDATGIPDVRLQAVDAVRLWGRVCFVGEGNTTTFDISRQIIHRQLTIYGSWTFSTGGLAEVAQFVTERRAPLRELITHRFPLEQAAEAYRVFEEGKTGKVVLTME